MMKWGFIYTLDDPSPNHELAAFPLAQCSMVSKPAPVYVVSSARPAEERVHAPTLKFRSGEARNETGEESFHHLPQARRISRRRHSGFLRCWPLGRYIARPHRSQSPFRILASSWGEIFRPIDRQQFEGAVPHFGCFHLPGVPAC